MRPLTIILVLLIAAAVSAGLYWASGGRLLFVGLPLLFVIPVLGWRRRS